METKAYYTKSFNEFEKAIKKAIKLSRDCAGIPSPTGRHYYASALFTKLCVAVVSLQKLVPDPKYLGFDAHWDYASACSITRNVIECYLVFYYFCVDEVDEVEWDARWRLFNLHDCLSRKKMFSSVGIEPEEQAANVIEITENELNENSYFKRLSEKQQNHYLKGSDAFFMSQDEIVKSYGGDVEEFRFIYRFLSSQVHSLPMAFYRMSEQERGRGVESEIEVGYTALSLDIARQYIEKAYNDYKRIFQNVEGVRVYQKNPADAE